MASTPKKAVSVIDVILGEAVSGPPQRRLEDMRAIASVILNRARRLRVTPEEVVSAYATKNKRKRYQFKIYDEDLPAGVESYRKLAERALEDVERAGPTSGAMYYATPRDVPILLKDNEQFRKVFQTAGHVYFEDPANKEIITAAETRKPTAAPASRPREQTPNYDHGQLQGLPRGVEFSLMNQEPLVSRRSVSPVDSSRFANDVSFWSDPYWQSYLFDYARQRDNLQNVPLELPDKVDRLPQPRPGPANMRLIDDQRTELSPRSRGRVPVRTRLGVANPLAALLGTFVAGRPSGSSANVDLAGNDPGVDPTWRTSQMRMMQQAGFGPREILQALIGSGRRSA